MALNAIITAGGQLPRELREHSPSRVKALLRMHEVSLLESAVHALQESGLFARIAVVGNHEVREATPHGSEHVDERESLVSNIQAGFEHLGGEQHNYLILSPDLPFVSGEALRDFSEAAAASCGMGFVYVTREDFLAHFPDAPNTFTRVGGAEVTLGSCVYMTGPMLRSNIPLARDFYRWRKSPLRMATLLGLPIALGFLTGRLHLPALERRVSRITGGDARALRLSHAGIAYDIDTLDNYTHALRVLGERKKHSAAQKDLERSSI